MESQRVRHDWTTFTTKTVLPGESPGQRTLVGYSPWIAKGRTQLKWLRTHANIGRNPSGLDISQAIAMKWEEKSALEDLIDWHFEEKNISTKEDDLCVVSKMLTLEEVLYCFCLFLPKWENSNHDRQTRLVGWELCELFFKPLQRIFFLNFFPFWYKQDKA